MKNMFILLNYQKNNMFRYRYTEQLIILLGTYKMICNKFVIKIFSRVTHV